MNHVLGAQARKKLLKGVKLVASVVSPTLGPKGRYVVLGGQKPIFTNDGATIAHHLKVEDPLESVGAELVKEVAVDVARAVGDGTTTATILTYELFKRALESDSHSTDIVRELASSCLDVVQKLEAQARPATTEELLAIGSRACKDKVLGQKIAELIHTLGPDSHIFVEEGTESEVVEGSVFPARYLGTQIPLPKRSEMPVLCLDYQFTDMGSVLSLIEDLIEQNRKELLVVATGFDGEALQISVENHNRGAFSVYVYTVESVKDIALTVGAKVLQPSHQPNEDDIGNAVVVLSQERVVVLGGDGQKAIDSLKLDNLPPEIVTRRQAQLSGHVGFLRLSGNSSTEIQDKKIRADDGIRACQATLRGGVVQGGGVAYTKAIKDKSIMSDAIGSIQRIINQNAGVEVPTEGVVDPLLVLTTALSYATTAACHLIVSEAILL